MIFEPNEIPKWKYVKLGDICNIMMGQSPPSSTYNKDQIGLPFYQGRKNFGNLYPKPEVWCSEPKRIAKKGDILISVRAPIGDLNVSKEECCIGRGLAALSMKNGNNDFLFYLLANYKKKLHQIFEGEGTVFGCITKSGLNDFEVYIPINRTEQNLIGKFLRRLDNKIELNIQMNNVLEAIAQAIFKHWFLDFEFPNAEGKPYKSSGGEMVYNNKLGITIPKGWDIKPIDQIANFLNGLALQKYPPEIEDEYLPVIKIRELRQGITDSSDKASVNIPKEYIVDDGDIIFSWSGSLEVVIWTHGKGALNQHLFKVTSDNYPKWFYYYWIKQHLPEYRHIAEEKATTMGHIQRHHLSNSIVLVPNKDELSKMDSILSPIVDLLIKINVESEVLIKIRDTLLPKLMSGKIRVTLEGNS
ncbi:MAG: restriction endonuclease subunit S [Candidatus Helarchaeota archaeon]